MAYRSSDPLQNWSGRRQSTIETLQAAHANTGNVAGPGRPKEIGRPLAHGYVLCVVAEFQAFTRDLHDLAALRLVQLAQPNPTYEPMLVAAITEGRQIDRGNADMRNLTADFKRLGVRGLTKRLGASNSYWKSSGVRQGDAARYEELIQLRNCLAHGNQSQLEELRRNNVLDTVSWTRSRLPSLTRTARALDRVVWQHLLTTFGVEPW